jgi:hypothetical protein
MTRDSRLIDFLEGYLDEHEGHTPLPDEVRDAIRAELPSTHQRPAWWPGWRFPEMNTTAKYALGAAAAVLVAVVGFAALTGGGNVGDPGSEESAAASGSPEAARAAQPASGDALDPGRYYIDVQPHDYDADGRQVEDIPKYRAEFQLPSGWTGLGRAATKDGSLSTSLSIEPPHTVMDSPCDLNEPSSNLTDVPAMRDPAGFTARLAEMWQGGEDDPTATTPTETTIAGYSASYVEVSTPDDIDFEDCASAKFQVWTGRWLQQPGQLVRIWVIDLEPGLLLFESSLEPGATAAEVAEADAIMASMTIDALESAP